MRRAAADGVGETPSDYSTSEDTVTMSTYISQSWVDHDRHRFVELVHFLLNAPVQGFVFPRHLRSLLRVL